MSELFTCIMIQQDEPEPEGELVGGHLAYLSRLTYRLPSAVVLQDASVTVDATSPSHRLTTHALWHALASSFASYVPSLPHSSTELTLPFRRIHRNDLANLAGAEDLHGVIRLLDIVEL